MSVRFEWDINKAVVNETKHNVSFAEAATVFRDPIAVIFDDEAHSNEERREFIIGHSAGGHLLLVCFSERDDAIRIISARQVTRRERRDYEEFRIR